MDLHKQQWSIDIGGETLTIEMSRMAEQASAAVMGRLGDTVVLTTVVMSDDEKHIDYFPLTVQYEERHYAAGKILGSRFVRREARPSDEAILSGRLVDRTIRPLFNPRIRREVQVVSTVFSIDGKHDPDFVALITASLALGISEIPWDGPVGGMKIVRRRGSSEIEFNTGAMQLEPDMEFMGFVSGTANEINMIEFEGMEVKEEEVAEAIEAAQGEIRRLIKFQQDIIKEKGKEKVAFTIPEKEEMLRKEVIAFLRPKLAHAMYATASKMEREKRIKVLEKELHEDLEKKGFDEELRKRAVHAWEEVVDEVVHEALLEEGKRPDGRKPDEVRELHAEVGLFTRVHGSALFVRGNTQALATVTLAPPSQELLLESMRFSGKRRFLLHYNFPPYSVGETGPFRGPGRREIGHGNLASKALRNMVPISESFPYTIRVASEILSSNGSSSMATVCGGTLALMDAGVPIKKPVAGIAMGLMSNEKGAYTVLTDIQGPEDHYGDMDMKVAGTKDGVTAMQMDVKIRGISMQMLVDTLRDAKKARLHILEAMLKALPASRPNLSPYAPMILVTKIPVDKIGELIGPGGKVINGIIDRYGLVSLDIDEDGTVFVSADAKEKAEAAMKEVKGITREYIVGEIVEGDVIKILEFGAIVDLGGGKDGMIHVSELKAGFVKKVEEVVKVGDHVRAKIIKAEDGRIGLSLKGV